MRRKSNVVLLVIVFLLTFVSLAGCHHHKTFKLGGIGHTKTISKEEHGLRVSIDFKRVKEGVTFTESVKNVGGQTISLTYDEPLSRISIDSSNGKISETLPKEEKSKSAHQIKLKPKQAYGKNRVRLPKGKYEVTATFYLKKDKTHVTIPMDFTLILK